MKYMALTLIVLGLVLVSRPLHVQEEALTPEICTANAAAWFVSSDVSAYIDATAKYRAGGQPNTTLYSMLPIGEVWMRNREMTACAKVDKPNGPQYHLVGQFYFSVANDRTTNFMARHHLLDQFYREDGQGVR